MKNIIQGENGIQYIPYMHGVLARVYWIDGEPKYHKYEAYAEISKVLTCKLQGQYPTYLKNKLGSKWKEKLADAGVLMKAKEGRKKQKTDSPYIGNWLKRYWEKRTVRRKKRIINANDE